MKKISSLTYLLTYKVTGYMEKENSDVPGENLFASTNKIMVSATIS